MEITPRQTTAVATFVVLIVLYCMPVLMLGWYLWSIGLDQIEYSQPIPQMVVTFNSGGGEQSAAEAGPDLLGMLHRVLVPVATLISGLLAVTLSRSRLNYYLIGILLLLIVLVFATYVMMGISANAAMNAGGAETAPGSPDGLARIAISTVLSRTFDTLFSFVLLFLGIAVAVTDGGSPPETKDEAETREPAPPPPGSGVQSATGTGG